MNPFMIRVRSQYKYYPLFDAYCRNRGLLFWLFGGGFKHGFTKDNEDFVEYNVWRGDADFLRHMRFELSE